MCPHLSANYVLGCPSNMAQVSVWAGNLHWFYLTYVFWRFHCHQGIIPPRKRCAYLWGNVPCLYQ